MFHIVSPVIMLLAAKQHHLEDGGLYVDLLAEHQHVAWPAGLVF